MFKRILKYIDNGGHGYIEIPKIIVFYVTHNIGFYVGYMVYYSSTVFKLKLGLFHSSSKNTKTELGTKYI